MNALISNKNATFNLTNWLVCFYITVTCLF